MSNINHDQEVNMIVVTYETYSKILDKTFVNVERFKSLDDWNLRNLALFHGQARTISVDEVAA